MRQSSGTGVAPSGVQENYSLELPVLPQSLHGMGWLQEVRPSMLFEGICITDVLHDGRRVLVSSDPHDLVQPSAVCGRTRHEPGPQRMSRVACRIKSDSHGVLLHKAWHFAVAQRSP